jgi:putative glutamine amidotransferase
MASDNPPAIGITCFRLQAEQQHHPLRFGQNQSYIHAVFRAGAAPLLLPLTVDRALLRTIYDRLDGLLLPGGGDVDPAHYGEAVHEKCGLISPGRDEMELALARWAAAEGKPLLAICRGIQVLNVALGGSLYQDIGSQIPDALLHTHNPDYPRDHLPHTAAISPNTRLAHLVGTNSLPINSLHHQAIKDVALQLTVTARTPDRVIEAVEMSKHPFALGVQWHPEELAPNDARAQRLFDALVKACQ